MNSTPVPSHLPETTANGSGPAGRLVISIKEAARVLGVSDDLVYELTERGELPCIRLGRRKLIPVRAIEMTLERAVSEFHPDGLLKRLVDLSGG